MAAFLPALPPSDVRRAAELVYQSFNPSSTRPLSSEEQRRLSSELFELQRQWQAWGLVVPFLEHSDQNVQFFGAHTIQVKIARDWDTFPQDQVGELKALILNLTARSIALGHSKATLRKLFVALCSLAIKLAPSRWPQWIPATVSLLSSHGTPPMVIIEFLEIAAEEAYSADLLPLRKAELNATLREAVPIVAQAIGSSISLSVSERQFESAVKCLEAWLPIIPTNELNPLIQPLVGLLKPSSPAHFVSAVSAINSILSSAAFADGAGSRITTEPLLLWLTEWGHSITSEAARDGPGEVANALCKLLAALGEHSSEYLAQNIASQQRVDPAFYPVSMASSSSLRTRSQLVLNYMRLMLSFTSLPGYYGVDEEESEMTLGFWYTFQEALWSAEVSEEDRSYQESENGMMEVSKAIYSELATVLRTKVRWPSEKIRWPKGNYRRDVGDTLINAYYVLRGDMLAYYLNDLSDRLFKPGSTEWEEVEATLHCIMSIQEALPVEPDDHLSRLFSQDILDALPTSGHPRVRRTMLVLIGSYASWFTTLPYGSPLLFNVISFVANALLDPSLCLPAANALRDLCDNNRVALASHIAAFGELHAGLLGIPETEKAKVLQSIASVIQALPPNEEIAPVATIVSPIVSKLFEAIQSSTQFFEDSRNLAVQQLQTLTGVAKGLTRTSETFDLDDAPDDSPVMESARQVPQMIQLREQIVEAIRATIQLWSTDAYVSDAISELFKSITALPSDITLISLPPAPLLECVCRAAQRDLTAVWLSLANTLIMQLSPLSTFKSLRPVVDPTTLTIVCEYTTVLVETTLTMLSIPGNMQENPEIVREFFHFLEKVSHHFVAVFFQVPQAIFDVLISCAITSMALTERYSLVAASSFLTSLINRIYASEDLGDSRHTLIHRHGSAIMRSLLVGFAGSAPKSTVANLGDLFAVFVSKYPVESKAWMTQILYGDDFTHSKAGAEAKETFIKTVYAPGSGTFQRRREAVRQFTIVARGQEGSNFGHAW
ncbi:armadillo-type protein [Vararia minispora EC-137]|uniref:Armadillo-type protein n=1 Tax=Vararia minispora EC-137 TaxID=1314806 RepID=A0ACB8QQG6_9AGAM|nr:armadillo-type protein [Vararia minispora EC-137]